MIPSVIRLYNPKAVQRLAVVSVQPAWAENGFLINVARGNKPGMLALGAAYGPFSEDQLQGHFAQVIGNLNAEGFLISGSHSAFEALRSTHARRRALAAKRLGWQCLPNSADALLEAWKAPGDEACTILDALGRTGDKRAIPILREQAARKLLSRRRSGAEGLRNIGDAEGLAAVYQRALEQLAPEIRQALNASDPSRGDEAAVQPLLKAVQGLDAKQHGLTLDFLYELGTPAAVGAVRAYLSTAAFGKAYIWRYVKSILKRSMLRGDHVMFGWLSHRIERHARTSKGETAVVKSGFDGETRKMPIFLRKTRNYVRRMTWRHLRELARYRPEQYTCAAAETLIHYSVDDESPPRELAGAFAHCYLLNQILFSGSFRLKFSHGSLRATFRKAAYVKAPTHVREERFAAYWDAHPRPYLRLLGFAQLIDVQLFAFRAIERGHKDLIASASAHELLPMLGSPLEAVAKLAVEELVRRFDPHNPDWALLEQVLRDQRPAAIELGRRWLEISADLWSQDAVRILNFLKTPELQTRTQIAEWAGARIGDSPEVRRILAREILALLEQPEPAPQEFEAYAVLARAALAADMNAIVGLEKILALLAHESNSVKSVAAALLALRPECAEKLGLEWLTVMAQHELAVVRFAAQQLLRAADSFWSKDPSVLLVLAESNWADTRDLAFELLRTRIDPQAIGFDGMMGLLDSNRPDVQDIGKEMALRQIGTLNVVDLLGRLIQHPHPNARWFAMDLIESHLPPGAEALEQIGGFCRAAMLDMHPRRALKDRLIAFFSQRGRVDAAQAAVATQVLGGFLRKEGRAEFESLLDGLVQIKLAHPETHSPVSFPVPAEERR